MRSFFSSITRSFSSRSAPYPKRTHNCGSLSAGDAGSRVILTGWLLPERKAKSFSFFPLKDSFGTTQLVIPHAKPNNNDNNNLPDVSSIPVESCVLVEGTVALRPPSARRPGPTGDVDVQVDKFILLNPATDLPFIPSNPHHLPNDEFRAQYRYLDLRRSALTENLKKRSQVAHIVRNVLHQKDFLEVETPVLLRSSPEGAREFLVPTRTSTSANSDPSLAGKPLFYALQQSPQQPKQLLICSGAVDRYFQIAKCFRDEDGRKDRQPEFSQIDMEMAYVSWGDLEASSGASSDTWRIGGGEVRDVVESLIRAVWKEVEGVQLPNPFKVTTYHQVMTRFGSDKPDTRFGLEIKSITDLLPTDIIPIFHGRDEVLECIPVRNACEPEFLATSRNCQSTASTHIKLTDENINTWLYEYNVAHRSGSGLQIVAAINKAFRLTPGDDVWIARRPRELKGGSTALGRTRLELFELARDHGNFTVTTDPHFLWVTEFPLFTKADSDKDLLAKGRWSSSHHPFTAPMWEDIDAMMAGNVEKVRGQHYDLVLNGMEIGGGSVRVHDAAMQDHIFTHILKLNEKEKAPFIPLLRALQCGAPPHGGIALGFDRLMAVLCKTQTIRDVIAFPKTSTGSDLLFKSPAAISKQVLSQYGIQPRDAT